MNNSESKLYFLPGLGFDKRLFENLKINSGQIVYLNWLEPESDESLEHYVGRLAENINPNDPNIILIGHSFGGIVVQELSKIIHAKKIIIISSIKSELEKPISLKFFKTVPIYKFFSKKNILITFPLWARIFGYNSEKGRKLFFEMISGCTDNYFKWSFNKITKWQSKNSKIENLFHIHGSNDKTFPISKIKTPIIIKDGSHFMVHSKAEEVSKEINAIISLPLHDISADKGINDF